ncbi:hypothetical protein ACFX2I_025806 [Malus domestica]
MVTEGRNNHQPLMYIGQVMEGEGDEEKGRFDPPLITSSSPGVETAPAPAPREARASDFCFFTGYFPEKKQGEGLVKKLHRVLHSNLELKKCQSICNFNIPYVIVFCFIVHTLINSI